MPPLILIGIAAGFVSVFMLVSAASGSSGARILVYLLAPLPCVLAGLGWGAPSAAIAGLTAATGIGLLIGSKTAVLQLLGHGIPIAILCHLVLQVRSVPSPASAAISSASEAPDGGLAWYPVGRLLAVAALFAGALAVLTTVLLGLGVDQLRPMLREVVDKIITTQFPGFKGRTFTEAEIATLVEMALYTMPAAAALTWLLVMALNFYLGGRITRASGRLARPWPDIPAMTFPAGFGLGLAIALPLTFLGGTPGLMASAFAGAFFTAHLLMGLAIIHDISRGVAARPFILTGLYVALVLLNSWAALALALFAILSPLLPLSRGNANAPD